MSYTKTNWVNGGTPAINATNLNKIETGIETAFNKTMLHDRELANIEAVLDIDNQAIANSGKFYDLFDATNNYSAGILDTTRTQLNGAHVAGGKILTVDSTTGFVAGQEITLQDDTNIEDGVIDSVDSPTQLTLVANLANNYKADADVYRSNVLVSGSKMNFGGWSNVVTYDHSTPVSVVASAYLTAGNGGRKIVVLSNDWIVAVAYDGGTNYFKIYKSTDNGATFAFVKNITNVTGAGTWAIASYGNVLYALMADGSGTGIYFRSTDMITEVQSSVITVDTQTSIGAGCSLSIDSTGNLHAAWCSKNATRPNSFNIRYSKSTDAGATWAAATLITTGNTSGVDWTTPSLVIASDKPLIISTLKNGSNYSIVCDRWNGSAWQTQNGVYDALTRVQENPSAVVDGAGVVHVAWDGYDGTDTSVTNIRYNKSSDIGATWGTASKLTTGNSLGQLSPSITYDASNNIYVVWQGQTGAGVYNIRQLKYTSSWGSIVELTASAVSDITSPSACSNYTSFTTPLILYEDTNTTSSVKFIGVLSASTTTSLLINKARYNIIPPMGTTTEIASWVQKERATTEGDFVVTAFESIVDTAADESYTAMTKSSTYIAANLAEDQFLMSAVTAQEKVTLKIVMTRATTSIAKAITKVLGAIN